MNISNPYASPNAPFAPPDPIEPSPEVVPPLVVGELALTKPWVRFLGILGWFGVVALIAIGAWLIVMTSSADPQGLFYGLVALVLAYPTVKLNRYASKSGI